MKVAELWCVALTMAAVALWVPPSAGRLLARRRVGSRPRAAGALGSRDNAPDLRVPSGPDLFLSSPRGAPAEVSAAQAALSGERGFPSHQVADRVVGRWRARGAAGRRRREVIELCTAIGTELRAGAMPVDALVVAIGAVPGLCDELGRSVILGGDAVTGLRRAATQPGAGGLARLAAAWTVMELTGTGLAGGCERVGAWLRDEEALRREVASQLAGARASARLLTVLPAFGLALGAGIGGDPIGFLLGTLYGLGCLVAGTALVLAGLFWTEWLARSVEAHI